MERKKKMAKKKPGRPPEKVPQDLADDLCAWIAEGKTLRDWCRQEGKPHFSTVYDWKAKDEEFSQRLARARDIGEDAINQECMAIADDGSNDWMERLGKDGKPKGWMLNGEHVQRSKLRIETRLKLLAVWNPKKYGELIKMEHAGKDGGAIEFLVKVDRDPGA
jgi:hypothetical protein